MAVVCVGLSVSVSSLRSNQLIIGYHPSAEKSIFKNLLRC